MFGQVYDELVREKPLYKYTAISSLLKIIREHWTIIDGKVVYADLLKPASYAINSHEIVHYFNTHPEEQKLTEEDFKEFAIYYKFFRLYQYNAYGNTSVLEFYPDDFFKELYDDFKELFERACIKKEKIFMPTQTRITATESSHAQQDGPKVYTDLRESNQIVAVYLSFIGCIIEWIHEGPFTDIKDLIKRLIICAKGRYRLIFVLFYVITRKINDGIPLPSILSADMFGFNKLLFNILAGLLKVNAGYKFINETEHIALHDKLDLSKETIINPMAEELKFMLDRLDNGFNITDYSEVTGEMARQLLNFLIVTNDVCRFKRLIMNEDNKLANLIIESSNGYTILSDDVHNLEIPFCVSFKVPIYITIKYYIILQNWYKDNIMKFMAVSINPKLTKRYNAQYYSDKIKYDIYSQEYGNNDKVHKIIYDNHYPNIVRFYLISPYGYNYTLHEENATPYLFDLSEQEYMERYNTAPFSPKNLTIPFNDILTYIDECIDDYDTNAHAIEQSLRCLNAFLIKKGFEILKRNLVMYGALLNSYVESIFTNHMIVGNKRDFEKIPYNSYILTFEEANELYGTRSLAINKFMSRSRNYCVGGKLKDPGMKQSIYMHLKLIEYAEPMYRCLGITNIFDFVTTAFYCKSYQTHLTIEVKIIKYVALFMHAFNVCVYRDTLPEEYPNNGETYKYLIDINNDHDSFFNKCLGYITSLRNGERIIDTYVGRQKYNPPSLGIFVNYIESML